MLPCHTVALKLDKPDEQITMVVNGYGTSLYHTPLYEQLHVSHVTVWTATCIAPHCINKPTLFIFHVLQPSGRQDSLNEVRIRYLDYLISFDIAYVCTTHVKSIWTLQIFSTGYFLFCFISKSIASPVIEFYSFPGQFLSFPWPFPSYNIEYI